MIINDAHCHFFSSGFFTALGRQLKETDVEAPHLAALRRLGWETPGSDEELSDRWASELDRARVGRAALIASVPGDAPSVARAVERHPDRFVGWFMVDPTQPDAPLRTAETLDGGRLRGVCLFPAMHRFTLQDDQVRRVFEVVSARPGNAMFVHCGVLKVGVRTKLGLPSRFDVSLGNPLHVVPLALDFPTVPVVIPHFGAGFFREALMAADLCPNIHLDTSSSNRWVNYHAGLTLAAVLQQALTVTGPDRLLFGSDSSFFPRGWVAQVYDQQSAALAELGVDVEIRAKIFGGNFDRLFPASTASISTIISAETGRR